MEYDSSNRNKNNGEEEEKKTIYSYGVTIPTKGIESVSSSCNNNNNNNDVDEGIDLFVQEGKKLNWAFLEKKM